MSIDLFEGLCDNFNCLFNHQPILQNEVCHFIKEFEEKRVHSGNANLQSTLHTLQEVQNIFPDVKELLRVKLGELNAAVLDASEMCKLIAENEDLTESSIKESLQIQESELNNERIKFDEHLIGRTKDLDQQVQDELELCKKYFSNIENNMKYSC